MRERILVGYSECPWCGRKNQIRSDVSYAEDTETMIVVCGNKPRNCRHYAVKVVFGVSITNYKLIQTTS